jgi:hypothetical protein
MLLLGCTPKLLLLHIVAKSTKKRAKPSRINLERIARFPVLIVVMMQVWEVRMGVH